MLELGCLDIGVVERCHFFNLYASAAICYLNGPQWAWRDNSIMECCVDSSGLACLHVDGCNAIELDDSNFVDVGQLNNQVGLDKTAFGNQTWFRYENGGTDEVQHCEVKQCVFDEGALLPVVITGVPTQIGYVNSKDARSTYPRTHEYGLHAVGQQRRPIGADQRLHGRQSGRPLHAKPHRTDERAAYRRPATGNHSGHHYDQIALDGDCGSIDIRDSSEEIVIASAAARTLLGAEPLCLVPRNNNGLPPSGQTLFTTTVGGVDDVTVSFLINRRIVCRPRLHRRANGRSRRAFGDAGNVGDYFGADYPSERNGRERDDLALWRNRRSHCTRRVSRWNGHHAQRVHEHRHG